MIVYGIIGEIICVAAFGYAIYESFGGKK